MKVLTITGGSLGTNCYIAWQEGQDKCVVVDPGFDAEIILERVRAKGLTVQAILLTHGHYDHVGGVKQLATETDCKVYLHAGDLQLPSQLTLGVIPCTNHFEDGEKLSLAGLEILVRHTPGHSPGSVCLLCENVIFAGDTLFVDTCGRTDLPGGSYRQIHDSLKGLAALEGEYHVLPGHGLPTTLERERRSNPYMQ